MRYLIQILCFINLFSHLKASNMYDPSTGVLDTSNYNSTRLPKFGPTVVKKITNLDTDLETLWGYMNKFPEYVRNITYLLTSRTYVQRLQLADAYRNKSNLGKVLLDDLNYLAFKYNIIVNFTVLFFNQDIMLRDFLEKSLGRSYDAGYAHILCTSSGDTLGLIANFNDYYYTLHKKMKVHETVNHLIDDKVGNIDGKRVLFKIVNPGEKGLRPDRGLDLLQIEDQVKTIPHKNANCPPKNNPDLLIFLTRSSFDQIKAVDLEFQKQNPGETILQRIDKHCKDDVRDAYRRIVYYSVDPFGYFAEVFHNGIIYPDSGGILDAVAIVALTRNEIDLKDIEVAHQRNYNTSLLTAMGTRFPLNDLNNYILYNLYKGNTKHPIT